MNRVALLAGTGDNRHLPSDPNHGQQYPSITYAEIAARAMRPPLAPLIKNTTDGIICADYTGWDLRKGNVGGDFSMQMLTVDFDNGNFTKEQVITALNNALGHGHAFTLYSTFSAWADVVDPETGEITNKGARWAAIIPLATGWRADIFAATSNGFLDLLEAQGVKIEDRTSTEIKRIRFLPVWGTGGYDAYVQPGALFSPGADHPFVPYAKARLTQQEQDKLAREKRQADFAKLGKVEGSRSVIAAYRRKHPTTPELMEWLGFTSIDGGRNWHHQSQSSNSYATELFSDGALYSLSGTVCSWGGYKQGQGHYFQDTFDIMCAVHYKGDRAAMYAYAEQCLKEQDEAWYGKACLQWAKMMLEGEWPNEYGELEPIAIWCGSEPLNCTAVAQKAAWQRDAGSLPTPTPAPQPAPQPAPVALSGDIIPPTPPVPNGQVEYVNLPLPQGFIGEVAKWVYHNYMHIPHWDFAILAAMFLCAGVAGRKDSFQGVNCGIDITALAINGAGKNTINQFISDVPQQLAERYRTQAQGEANKNGEQHQMYTMYMKQCYQMLPMAPTFGVTQLVQDLINRPSGVIVYPENGVAAASKAGDANSLLANIMQYTASDAHSRSNFKSAKENGGRQIYGVALSLFKESTKELQRQHMNSMQVASGQMARGLTVNVDVSKLVDEARPDRVKKIPAWILDGYERLIKDAYELEHFDDEEQPLAAEPSRPLDRPFGADQTVHDIIAQLMREDTAMRRANKANEADIYWAHGVRKLQVVKKYMLLLARTDAVVYGRSRIVTAQHYADADAFVGECRRCEIANAVDYDDAFERLQNCMHKKMMATVNGAVAELPAAYVNCIPKLTTDIFNTHEAKQQRAQECRENGMFPLSYFTMQRCRKSHQFMMELKGMQGTKWPSMSPKDIYMEVFKAGDGSLWHLAKEPFIHVVLPKN